MILHLVDGCMATSSFLWGDMASWKTVSGLLFTSLHRHSGQTGPAGEQGAAKGFHQQRQAHGLLERRMS